MLIDSTDLSENLRYILGMPWPGALLIICLILLIIDMIFFGGDGLTYLVHFLLTVIILHYLPITNWLWLTLISFFVYGGILALHLFCWRTIISKFLNHVLAPDQIKIGNEALIGSRGALRNIDGHWMIHIGEEWIPCNINLPVSNSVSIIYGIVTDIVEDKNLVVSLEIDNKEAKNVLQ